METFLFYHTAFSFANLKLGRPVLGDPGGGDAMWGWGLCGGGWVGDAGWVGGGRWVGGWGTLAGL